MKYEEIKALDDCQFKRLTGVKRAVFEEMSKTVKENAPRKGRPPKLSYEDQVLLTLMYWREYRTLFHIGQEYGVHESTVSRIVRRVENALLKSKKFHLPGKKALQDTNSALEVVLVDATEQPVERPTRKQRKYYSGKKRRHTQKAQVIVDGKTGRIIATAFGPGSKHDFRLFKENWRGALGTIKILADKGYQGLQHYHPNSETPIKKRKGQHQGKEEREANRRLSRRRILVENIIGRLKVFRILSERYRNRRKRFGLRFNLIAAIHNLELAVT